MYYSKKVMLTARIYVHWSLIDFPQSEWLVNPFWMRHSHFYIHKLYVFNLAVYFGTKE